jgi:hypothetical protein
VATLEGEMSGSLELATRALVMMLVTGEILFPKLGSYLGVHFIILSCMCYVWGRFESFS